MPSSNHVVVVTDLSSRYPAAKLVKSTKADQVIPALSDIYDTYGDPKCQISDNGPPFDSKRMEQFATSRAIELRKIPPHHPSANPAETFMRTLGKGMKIGRRTGVPEKETLRDVVRNYRQTPHPSTGLPPAAMLFRDGYKGDFPRQDVSEADINAARSRDVQLKQANEQLVNSSKYRKTSQFKVGDFVYVRNFQKNRKFDSLFLDSPFVVADINDCGNKLQVKQLNNNITLWRHPDDLKPFHGSVPDQNHEGFLSEPVGDGPFVPHDSHDGDERYFDPPQVEVDPPQVDPDVQEPVPVAPLPGRRTGRVPVPNPRYFNDNMVNTITWL